MNRYERVEGYSDLGLGTDEPAIHRFTRAVERAERQALADHQSRRCADSEWSCRYCQEKTPADGQVDEGNESIPHEGMDHHA